MTTPKLAKSKGNMYPWVSHMFCHLGGECSHKCVYCYVNYKGVRPERYTGPIHIVPGSLDVRFGKGKTIFMEHMNDLFAEDVPSEMIEQILAHCRQFPDNLYVFQTKNPIRLVKEKFSFPPQYILGCTIETNRIFPDIGQASVPQDRYVALLQIEARKFITIEPILDFDPDILGAWIGHIRPEFINIGADSKGHGLPEPSAEKIWELVRIVEGHKIEIREKHNLARIIGEQPEISN